MLFKVARLSVFGIMACLAPLALPGCLTPEGDESAIDESATDEPAIDDPATDESGGKQTSNAVCTGTVFDFRIETCQSGWPGNRTCTDTITSASDIVLGTIDVAISGRNGEVRHSVSRTGARQINFSATVHEGDVFNPGKNTTTYFITWCRR